jgi:hypothetical protein
MEKVNCDDPTTWEGKNLNTMTMAALYTSFGLEE